jgi:hypothetical protein
MLFLQPLHRESFPFSRVRCVCLYPDTQPNEFSQYQLFLEWQSDAPQGLARLSIFSDKARAKDEANRLASVLSTRVSREASGTRTEDLNK